MILEDFSTVQSRQATATIDRAEVFDEGYRQGWDDAASAIKSEDLRLGIRLASHLEGMAHNQAAATSLCLAQIEPLLTEIFDKVLPRAADRAFLTLVIQEAEAMLQDANGAALSLRVAPEALGPLQSLIDQSQASLATIRLEAEPGLDPMQARLAHPNAEREIDVARVLDAMDDAFEAFCQTERTQNDD